MDALAQHQRTGRHIAAVRADLREKTEAVAKTDKWGVVITPSQGFVLGHVELAGLAVIPERMINFNVKMVGRGNLVVERIEIRRDDDSAQK